MYMHTEAGQLLQRARRRAGLTQAELARRVGTTQSAIARLERGATSPSFSRLSQLVAACGFELQASLAPLPADNADTDAELGAFRRNLALSYDERLRNVVAVHDLVAAGRASLAATRAPRAKAKARA